MYSVLEVLFGFSSIALKFWSCCLTSVALHSVCLLFDISSMHSVFRLFDIGGIALCIRWCCYASVALHSVLDGAV